MTPYVAHTSFRKKVGNIASHCSEKYMPLRAVSICQFCPWGYGCPSKHGLTLMGPEGWDLAREEGHHTALMPSHSPSCPRGNWLRYLSYPLPFFKIYINHKIFCSLIAKPGFLILNQEGVPQICSHHWYQHWALKQNPKIRCIFCSSLPPLMQSKTALATSVMWLHVWFCWLSATIGSYSSVTSQMCGYTMLYWEEDGLLACLPLIWMTLNQ